MTESEQIDRMAALMCERYIGEPDRGYQAAAIDLAAFLVSQGVRMPPTCPECAAGKHWVCSALAADPWTDEPRECQCPESQERP